MDVISLQYLIILFSAIVGFFAALKPVRAFLYLCWARTLGRGNAARLIRELEIISKQDEILSELRPNGGDSLRDSVNRIEHRQGGFDAFLTAQLNVQDKAIFRTDAFGKCTYNNRKHQRLTGFSAGEVEGDGWINVIHPKDRDMIYIKWQHAVDHNIEFSEDIRYVKPGGEVYLVHVNAYRELDADGVIRGYLGVVVPLTEEGEIKCPHMERCLVNEKNS